MDSFQNILSFLTIFTSFINPTTPQPCNSYIFPNNLKYESCRDLHVLESSLHWNYNPTTSILDIAFKKNNVNYSSWIAWGINPTSKGMVGTQALIGYPDSFNGSLRAYTASIEAYAILREGNISYPVYSISGMNVNSSMMIFAILKLPQNVSLVNHVWQEGLVSDGGRLEHATSGPNIQSFGTLDFKSGNIVAQNVGEKLRSRITLYTLFLFYFFYFII
jgi:hypothetical protein